MGIDALSATLGEDKQTIEEVYEPYLLKSGLLLRTPRGRVLSQKALEHLKLNKFIRLSCNFLGLWDIIDFI